MVFEISEDFSLWEEAEMKITKLQMKLVLLEMVDKLLREAVLHPRKARLNLVDAVGALRDIIKIYEGWNLNGTPPKVFVNCTSDLAVQASTEIKEFLQSRKQASRFARKK